MATARVHPKVNSLIYKALGQPVPSPEAVNESPQLKVYVCSLFVQDVHNTYGAEAVPYVFKFLSELRNLYKFVKTSREGTTLKLELYLNLPDHTKEAAELKFQVIDQELWITNSRQYSTLGIESKRIIGEDYIKYEPVDGRNHWEE